MRIQIPTPNGKRKALTFDLDAFERRVILNDVYFSQNYFPRINSQQDFSIRPSDTIIDVGANVGVFSVYGGNLAKRGKVYAFEPVQRNFDRLEEHLRINKVANVTAVHKGLSNKAKKTKVYLCKGNSGGHSTNKNKFRLLHETTYGTESIECLSLKDVFDQYRIKRCDFLKLDCEGEEARILTALPARYFKRIEKIALEFHKPVVDELKLARFLYTQGYRVTISNYGYTLGMIFAVRV